MDQLRSTTNRMSRSSRQYRLIVAISLELIALGLVFVYINFFLKLWIVLALLTCGLISIFCNLWLLQKKRKVELCGHILILSTLIVAVLGNIFVGGLNTVYFGWFYVMPVISAAILNTRGLIIYSILTGIIFMLFIFFHGNPILHIDAVYLSTLTLINRIFIYVVIITTLYSLMYENRNYELLLEQSNIKLDLDRKKFHYLSRHDPLTNLPNRSYFLTYLEAVLGNVKERGDLLTVFFMDLDNFKEINDQHGHEAGDQLLLLTGKRLQNCLRRDDFLARLGGDEFTAVIVDGQDGNSVKTILDRIITEFKNPFVINENKIHCHISVGLASYPRDATTVDELLQAADHAMYITKNQQKTDSFNT